MNASATFTNVIRLALADSLPPGNSRSKLVDAAKRVEGPRGWVTFDDAAADLLSTAPAKLQCAR
jgi:hypothetical protein